LQRFKEVEQSMLEADAQPSVLKLKQPIEQPSAFEQPVDVALPSPVAPANADIDSLFLMFKQGVETQVDAQDSRTQYDLGMMFMEMGRLEEARIAFENAAKDPARACVSLSMIASIHQRSGHAEQALQVLQRALSIECKSRSEEVGVQYELSRLFEAREQFSQAIQHLEQVVHLAPDFRDARTRLDSLRQQVHRGEVTIADDELERVFDDLIGPSKKA
jgi:tetratricopeptide (TPR) repeat protein